MDLMAICILYLNIQQKNLTEAKSSVENLVKCMKPSKKEPFDLQLIIPNQEESEHWTLVQKAQLAKALVAYVINENSSEKKTFRSRTFEIVTTTS